ncbi:hypothetical protein G5V59_11065 [Nocardioides sp. W3-2-3]|uniref:hypothetical protein n=1 Tax=Nocardioides convexus TaxID=2712224 RepID=UPI00241825A0|nr:hypothetical protein [Nocardioides convexus]NHA00428.1 hypothetical protein [Nocardioides convexus]
MLAGLGVARVAPAAAAAANDPDGWNWTYSAVIGSETYQIRWKEGVRAASTAKSSATITVTDRSADGLGQRVQWRVYGATSWNYCYNTTGAGTSKVCSVSKGKFIQYKALLEGRVRDRLLRPAGRLPDLRPLAWGDGLCRRPTTRLIGGDRSPVVGRRMSPRFGLAVSLQVA